MGSCDRVDADRVDRGCLKDISTNHTVEVLGRGLAWRLRQGGHAYGLKKTVKSIRLKMREGNRKVTVVGETNDRSWRV